MPDWQRGPLSWPVTARGAIRRAGQRVASSRGMVFRVLVLGLLGADLLLQITRPYEIRVERFDRSPVNASIIDVARSVRADQLPAVVRLGPGERVVAVDGEPVADDLAAGAALASHAVAARTYIDLELAGPGGSRRVLVLLH